MKPLGVNRVVIAVRDIGKGVDFRSSWAPHFRMPAGRESLSD